MWAYYANAHDGIVLKYSNDDVHQFSLNKVSYTRNRHQSDSDNYLNILTQKDTAWKHEDEYRIITTEKFISIKPIGCIIGIDVGDEIKHKIHNKCNELGIECLDTSFSESSGELYLYNEVLDILYYPSDEYDTQCNWSTFTSSNTFTSYKKYKYSELVNVESDYSKYVINKKTDAIIYTPLDLSMFFMNKSINNVPASTGS